MTDRINYVGSALAALDQALNSDPSMLSRNDSASRAQAFALLAIAEQARLANLIAYKQLHTSTVLNADGEVDYLPIAGDGLTDEIENGLGLA